MRGCGGVGDLEATLLEVVTIIEEGSRDKAGALGIHDHVDVAGADENVPISRAVNEVHLVLQAGATATDDGQSQRAVRTALAREQRVKLLRGFLGDFAKLLVPKGDLGCGLGGLGNLHAYTMLLIGDGRKQRSGRWRRRVGG